MKKKTGGTRAVPHRWLLTSEQEIEAIALAQLCLSNKRIAFTTGLKDQSVSYILGKAKKLEGYQKFVTYRSVWRDGSGTLVKQVISQVLPKLKEQAGDRLPPLITHATPKIVEQNEKSNSMA